ncbi:hypothetical protein FJT64_026034 [Amphibalanus amphitrite]|uniref:Uncharacterized protein n=1 Tax=Amphibalanus amphitrite TaxID=1232801 RepID=A0A6A4WD65_AMPAM|nr:hypothetical protein FJT64_026034 [Amphibalanus amphitrite]
MFALFWQKRLVCQHYARRKPGKTCKASPRDTGCPVTLDIRVRKVTFQKNAKSRSKKPDAGYALQVKARGQHNHPLETATVLKFRRVSDRTRERIVELFRHHHSPATALRTLKLQLQAEHGERYPLIAADRGILPDTNYFYKLHKKFLASECGEQRTAGSVDQQPSAGSVDQQPTAGSVVDQQPTAGSVVDQQPSAAPDDGDDTAYHDGDDTAYHDGDDTAYHDGEMEETDGDMEPSASPSGADDHLQTMRDEIKARLDSFTRRVLKWSSNRGVGLTIGSRSAEAGARRAGWPLCQQGDLLVTEAPGGYPVLLRDHHTPAGHDPVRRWSRACCDL